MRRLHRYFAIALVLGWGASLAHADDYDPESSAWNGLAQFAAIARDAGARVETPQEVDVGLLQPNDALVLVYPRGDLPIRGLSAFMQAGGRVVLADDFGGGDALLGVYRIRRSDAITADAPRIRGNSALLVAQPALRHVLTDGTQGLVTNHPTVVRHAELRPLFAFGGEPEHGVVLAGMVGSGRMVAISDPSVLINNMLEFHDNARFASNLIRYLDGGGRIIIASGDTPVRGEYGEPGATEPLHQVERWLSRAAKADLPPLAIQLAALVLAAILLVVAATALPRSSPYLDTSSLFRPGQSGGFFGRVEFFHRHSENLLNPALVYKYELEMALFRKLHLSAPTDLRTVLARARERTTDQPALDDLRGVLLELDDLARRQDHPPSPPRVSAARLAKYVRIGERALAALSPDGQVPLEGRPSTRLPWRPGDDGRPSHPSSAT